MDGCSSSKIRYSVKLTECTYGPYGPNLLICLPYMVPVILLLSNIHS